MDPEQLFREMVDLADEIMRMPETNQELSGKMHELTDKIQDMDDWVAKGGFAEPEWMPVIEEKLVVIRKKVELDKARILGEVSA